jgi:hypothetical protein
MDEELRRIIEKHLSAAEADWPDRIVIELKPQSDAERRSRGKASNGLLDGDLRPLAAHIRAGFSVDSLLAEQLADAIEGPDDEGFTLKMVAPKGHMIFSERDRLYRRNADIALAVWLRHKAAIEAGERGTYAAIIMEVAGEFGVSEGTVKTAVARIRSDLEQ